MDDWRAINLLDPCPMNGVGAVSQNEESTMKILSVVIASLFAIPASAEVPLYTTVGIYSPMKTYDKTASWTLPKRPRGYLATISAAMRFDPAISDYITCNLPGMTGAAGNEKIRFSVSFSETKTVTMTGYVAGTSLQFICASEGQKLSPISLDAAMTAVSLDQAIRR